MTQLWDVVVVGAGPAGCRAAELFAKRGAQVALLDPKAPWEKPCGGGLTSAALRHTPELRELRSESQTISELMVRAPGGASVVVPLRSPYYVVSRLSLSRWGLDRADVAGARFLSVAAERVERDRDTWRVTDSGGGKHKARWLVAADGATSRLRGLLAPNLRPELAPTRVGYARLDAPLGRAVFLFLSATDGYLWDFPRPDHRSVGIGVPPGTFARGALDEALAQYLTAEVGANESAEYRGAVIATSNWTSGGFEDLGGRDYVLLGDAAGLADCATGEGIDYALRSATLAAQVLDSSLGFEGYPAVVRAAFAKEIHRALLIRRWLYRAGVADRLLERARRSPRAALLLTALLDAVNEHSSLRGAIIRSLLARTPDGVAAGNLCNCSNGLGAFTPKNRPNQAAISKPPPGEAAVIGCTACQLAGNSCAVQPLPEPPP
jgi:flavin-dependent dehydrogenase